ncbi:unnamed protein product, partial [Prorocentrum cordatum]
AKDFQKLHAHFKQLVAENRKLKFAQDQKSQGAMEDKIDKSDQAIKIYAETGDTELAESTRLKLEATVLQIKDLRTPATAHKQCSQML